MTDVSVGKPEISYGLARNTFEWADLSLKVVVDRITEDGKSELYFYHTNTAGTVLLHMGQANLLSSTMQSQFMKSLSSRGPEIDWQTVLTYIARDTIAHLREGEPVVWLDEKYGKKPPAYLLPPFFIKNAANIIYADRSSAKTLFITLIDLALSLPWYTNEIGLNITPQDYHKVLYLDWEGSAEIMGWQKECIRRGMNIEICDIPYLHCSRSLADDISHIQHKVEEVKADVVIIDSLGMAVGDDLNLTKPAFNFFAALRHLPVTPLIVAHTAKGINTWKRTVYGNAYYENEARSIWELKKRQDTNSPELTLTMHHRKPPPFAPTHEPIAFLFTFDGNRITVESATASPDTLDDNKRTVEDKILNVLMNTEKRLSQAEIIHESKEGLKDTSVAKTLQRMLKKKDPEIMKDNNGNYFFVY